MYFSPATRGFYHPDVHEAIPPDAIAVTPAEHAALMAAQSAGAVIGLDSSGHPVAVMPDAVELLRRAKLGAEQAVRRALEDWMQIFTAGVPDAEIASWPTKAEAAALHLAGGQAAPILVDEAALTGETTQVLAGKISALSAVYTSAVARAAALRRNAYEEIDAAATPAAVAASLAAALADITAAAAGQPLPSMSEETPE